MDIHKTYPHKEANNGNHRIFQQPQPGGQTAKAVALPENVKRVEVIAVGRTRIITPAGETWDEWFDGHNVSADFMDNREQPGMQERESF